MQTVSVKGNSANAIIPILRNALDREKRIIEDSLRITQQRVSQLASELDVDADAVISGEAVHPEKDDMKYVELEGEIEILKHLKAELSELESVEICT